MIFVNNSNNMNRINKIEDNKRMKHISIKVVLRLRYYIIFLGYEVSTFPFQLITISKC